MTNVKIRIDECAKTVGNKAANLLELQAFSQQIDSLPISVRVPELHTLDHQLITDHLDKTAPSWRVLWAEFVEEQNKADPGSLSTSALTKLHILRELILNTFVKHPISMEVLREYIEMLPEKSLLMIRSTGKEDTVDLANPGGNESIAAVAPNESAISKAIGEVIASYFSEKSLKQRLISNDDITASPFMPVLLQRMIGEPLLGEEKIESVIRSGVMYTGEAGTRLQLAPGHGELIVNSKAPFDTFFISRENVVYSEIYRKTHRLIPIEMEDGSKIKRKLELYQNPSALQIRPTVPSVVVQAIAKVGRLIEQHYGMPMDVEFVYHPAEKTLYLVQARPIPKGDLKTVAPSSIPPEKFIEIKKTEELCPAEVITPAGSAAQIITQSKELLICDNIGQALEYYLQQKNSSIKAVIVREMAPETSHEAAQFNAKAIPVLAVDDIARVKEWMVQDKLVVIIDPQRKQLVNLKMQGIKHEDVKQELFASGIIKEGFFKSPMASQVTLQSIWNRKIAAPSVTSALHQKKTPDKTSIGDLILKGNSLDPKESKVALEQLLTFILAQLDELKKYSYPNLPHDKLFSLLNDQIILLESAQPGKKQKDEIWQALHTTFAIFYKLASSKEGQKKNHLYQTLFQHAVITGAEIFLCLQRLSNDRSGNLAIQEEYLGLVSKLEGLIINPGKAGMFSGSLRQVAQDKKSFEKARVHPGFDKLTTMQQGYFIEFFKIGKLALNNHIKQQWLTFAFECCRDPKKIAKLATVLKFSMDNNITFDLVNNTFSSDNKEPLDHEAVLDNMVKEMNLTHRDLEKLDILKKKAIMQSWERRISDWSNPHKIDTLLHEYEREFLPLIQQLSIDNDMSNLSKITIIKLVQQMTDIMDRTIKTMKGSPEYSDELKVQYFSTLLSSYHELMSKWVSREEVIVQNQGYSKASILQPIEYKFNKLKKITTSNQLNPSGTFSVASAQIGSAANFYRQFYALSLTLEDMFTLFHQNIIASTVQLNNRFGNIQPKDLPKAIQPLLSALLNLQSCQYTSINCNFPVVTIELSLPLRNHATTFSLTYNQNTKKTKLIVNFYGHNKNNRMDYIHRCATLDAMICGVRELYPATYNANTQSVGYGWELSTAQVSELAPHIKDQIQLYANATFFEPITPNQGGISFQSGYQSTLTNKLGEKISRKRSMKLFKNAEKIESTDNAIERMKAYLTSLQKTLTNSDTDPQKQPWKKTWSARTGGISRLNQWLLGVDIENMTNPNEIKALFYKVAIELADRYYGLALNRDISAKAFYAEWYAKVFIVHRELGEPEHTKIHDIETDNAVAAQHYRKKIKPHLAAIYEKIQDHLCYYNKADSATQCYKDAADLAQSVLTEISTNLRTLEESIEKDAVNEFIKKSDAIINNALESKLAQHRGARKGVLGAIWHAILNLAIIITVLSQERKNYLMSTTSAQKIMDLKTGLTDIDQPQQATENPTHKPSG